MNGIELAPAKLAANGEMDTVAYLPAVFDATDKATLLVVELPKSLAWLFGGEGFWFYADGAGMYVYDNPDVGFKVAQK